MKRVFPLLFFCFLFNVVKSFGQTTSNEGINFWTVFPTHVPSNSRPENLAQLKIFITSKFDSEVTVSCGSGYSETKAIPANTAISFDVPRAASYVSVENILLPNKGIHIVVTPGKPKVSAYAHIYAGFRSAASLILPFETLGQTYYSMNYTQVGSGVNFLALVAVEDNTDLIITKNDGSTLSVNLLNAGDVYEYTDRSTDLTGISVSTNPTTSSCKRFAAFSGSSALVIGSCSFGAGVSQDPLYQQLYATASWGKNYGIVPFKDRKYIIRAVAKEDNTKIFLNGQLVATIDKGSFFYQSEELIKSALLTSDKLISVAQYSLTQKCSGANGGEIEGDPDMVILNPIEFNIKDITVFSSDLERINTKFLNVLIKYNQSASFKINGVKPNVVWQALNGDPTFAYAQIQVFQNSLTLSADDGFNVIAYGFGSAESYAYSAGTNLASNNYLSVVNTSNGQTGPDGCVGVESQLNIALPYKAKSITWFLDGGSSSFNSNPTVFETKNTNGIISYIYQSPYKQIFTNPASHIVQADVEVENTNPCITGNITSNYTFNIYDLPTAKIEAVTASCVDSNVKFSSETSEPGDPNFGVTEWRWDFGDGTDLTSADALLQSPEHKYATEGRYTVTLSVKSGTGCFSETASHQVNIYPVPLAKFDALSKSCIDAAVVFENTSEISINEFPESKIITWRWDFGDGTPVFDAPDGASFVHKFANKGTYTVSLVVTANNGSCSSMKFEKAITIVDAPIADFTLPDYCVADGQAKFINLSKNIDGTENGLTYLWTYKKDNVLGTSAAKDGKYAFSAAGDYEVTLSITNGISCEASKSKIFTVNPEVDEAKFTVKNFENLCSNIEVNINNTSTISSGKIVKIEIFKDFDNAPTNPIVIKYPGAEDISLIYPSFGGNNSKAIKILMRAYSGETCFKQTIQIISLNPSPQLEFNTIPKICTDVGIVIIDQGKEVSGLNGKGIYSGIGIDADGNFNSKVAGPGIHLLTYTFKGNDGCLDFKTQTVNVFDSPSISLPTQVFVLAGGQIKLPASATGDNLIYKWTPSFTSTFLDKDDILNPTVTPTADITYILTVSTVDGCSATAKVFVKVLEGLEVANAFSPNGDGVNDVWVIKYLETYPNATVEVFNRNGGRVFFSRGYDNPFDGNYQNSPLPVGVYYYIINPNNGRKLITGPLTIIK